MKVPITERALIARSNRKLAKAKALELEALKASLLAQAKRDAILIRLSKTRPGSAAEASLGTYFVTGGDDVLLDHVDLEAFAREIGALAPFEYLEAA